MNQLFTQRSSYLSRSRLSLLSPTRTAHLASPSRTLEAAYCVTVSARVVVIGSGLLLARPLFSEFKMARNGHYTKRPKLGPGCQQPQTALLPASAVHHDDSQNPRLFRPLHSELRPAPQTSTNSIQNSEPGHVNLDANATKSRKGYKTTKFWMVKIIDSDGTIKPAKLSVREAIEWPNGRRIMLKFNNKKQAIGDEAELLSGVLGLLGSDYGKFLICEESWHKITTKYKFYNECVKVKVYIHVELNLLICYNY
ncbi:hypothetical protein Ahy_B09g097969 [Arachis hypogaea]|uniref:Uncharacterized protein n=1 Tax=Arachis hypogaea TaxID=3818 RepID=A0A444XQF4_ARAHY|nr:hypothetical protein Ahy_B09g097969 [Arachis hypogaea]